MTKFFAFFMLPQDKASHAFWGTVIYWLGMFHSPEMGFALALVAALVKDILGDLVLKREKFDSMGIAYTVFLPALLMLQSKFL